MGTATRGNECFPLVHVGRGQSLHSIRNRLDGHLTGNPIDECLAAEATAESNVNCLPFPCSFIAIRLAAKSDIGDLGLSARRRTATQMEAYRIGRAIPLAVRPVIEATRPSNRTAFRLDNPVTAELIPGTGNDTACEWSRVWTVPLTERFTAQFRHGDFGNRRQQYVLVQREPNLSVPEISGEGSQFGKLGTEHPTGRDVQADVVVVGVHPQDADVIAAVVGRERFVAALDRRVGDIVT